MFFDSNNGHTTLTCSGLLLTFANLNKSYVVCCGDIMLPFISNKPDYHTAPPLDDSLQLLNQTKISVLVKDKSNQSISRDNWWECALVHMGEVAEVQQAVKSLTQAP